MPKCAISYSCCKFWFFIKPARKGQVLKITPPGWQCSGTLLEADALLELSASAPSQSKQQKNPVIPHIASPWSYIYKPDFHVSAPCVFSLRPCTNVQPTQAGLSQGNYHSKFGWLLVCVLAYLVLKHQWIWFGFHPEQLYPYPLNLWVIHLNDALSGMVSILNPLKYSQFQACLSFSCLKKFPFSNTKLLWRISKACQEDFVHLSVPG